MRMTWLFGRKYKPVAPAAPEKKQPDAINTHAEMIGGRRHLVDHAYALPKDDQEISRLDFQHYLLRLALKGNYTAPIEKPSMILDVGAGTAVWGKDMAAQFPDASVCGVDLENIKRTGTLPFNYRYVQGDVLQHLPLPDNAFDFVHQRLLVAAIPAQKWDDVITELMRVTKPGGWIELVECGIEITPLGPLTHQFFVWGLAASAKRGLDARIIPYLHVNMAKVGLTNLDGKTVDIPIGTWGGRMGDMMMKDLIVGFSALKTFYASQDKSEQEFDELLKRLPYEWEMQKSSIKFFVFIGQKPEQGDFNGEQTRNPYAR